MPAASILARRSGSHVQAFRARHAGVPEPWRVLRLSPRTAASDGGPRQTFEGGDDMIHAEPRAHGANMLNERPDARQRRDTMTQRA